MTTKREENWIAIQPGYDCHILLPASKATELLAHMLQLQHKYVDGSYVWTVVGDREHTKIQIVEADLITAARVAAKFDDK
jgi:hypothetical protein